MPLAKQSEAKAARRGRQTSRVLIGFLLHLVLLQFLSKVGIKPLRAPCDLFFVDLRDKFWILSTAVRSYLEVRYA